MTERADEPGSQPGAGTDAELPADDAVGAELDPTSEKVGDQPSGQLVAPDEGTGEDTEKDLVAEDLGYDEAGASAEEAAMHEIPEEPGG